MRVINKRQSASQSTKLISFQKRRLYAIYPGNLFISKRAIDWVCFFGRHVITYNTLCLWCDVTVNENDYYVTITHILIVTYKRFPLSTHHVVLLRSGLNAKYGYFFKVLYLYKMTIQSTAFNWNS